MTQTIINKRGNSLYPTTTLESGEIYICTDPDNPAIVTKDASGHFIVYHPNKTGISSSVKTISANGTFKDHGSVTIDEINSMEMPEIGAVYNIMEDGILKYTLEGSNVKVNAGANIVWTENGWDILGNPNKSNRTFEGQATNQAGLIQPGTDLNGMDAMDILEMMLKGHTNISIQNITSSDIVKVDVDSPINLTISTKNCKDTSGTVFKTSKMDVTRPNSSIRISATASDSIWKAFETVRAGTSPNGVTYTCTATSSHNNEKSQPMTFYKPAHYPIFILNSDKPTIESSDINIQTDLCDYASQKPTNSMSSKFFIITDTGKYTYFLLPSVFSPGNVNLYAGEGNTDFTQFSDNLSANNNVLINLKLKDGKNYEYRYFRSKTPMQDSKKIYFKF